MNFIPIWVHVRGAMYMVECTLALTKLVLVAIRTPGHYPPQAFFGHILYSPGNDYQIAELVCVCVCVPSWYPNLFWGHFVPVLFSL